MGLGVSNIQAHSVLLQFIPGFDGKTSITLWIVEAMEVEESTDYAEIYTVPRSLEYEPRFEKTGLRGFRPGPTQTGLYSHRRRLEVLNFGFSK